MNIFIARHGEASFDAPSDRQRPLTARGRDQTEALVLAQHSNLLAIELLWSSDLLRAQQTAAIYAARLQGLSPQVQTFLRPDSEPKRVLQHLAKLAGDASVLIVSHQPLVGELVSLLCEGHCYQPHPFTTSELVKIECEQPEPGLGVLKQQYLPS